MNQTDASVILGMMVVIAIVLALLYDLGTNVRRPRPKRGERERVDDGARRRVPAVPAPSVELPVVHGAIASAAPAAAAPAPARVAWSAPPQVSPAPAVAAVGSADADPLRALAMRMAALRLIGLDHVRETHPVFRRSVPAASPATIVSVSVPGVQARPTGASTPGRRTRTRRSSAAALAAARATGRLRVVEDAGRRGPLS